MKKRIIIALVILSTLGVLFLIFGVNWKQVSQAREMAAEAKKFKNNLIEALENADRVDIVEQSHPWDLTDYFPEKDVYDIPEFEYLRITLDSDQLSRLKELVGKMPTRPTKIPMLGRSPPHHSIRIYEEGKLKHNIQIDFTFFNTDWFWQDPVRSNPNTIAPIPFYLLIKDYFTEFGFQPNRTYQEWVALALEKAKGLEPD